MDDDTDIDSDVHPQPQLPIPLVEIVAFPDLNNLQPLIPEEILEEELMGWINGDNNELGGNQEGNLENELVIPQNLQQQPNNVDQNEQNQLMHQPPLEQEQQLQLQMEQLSQDANLRALAPNQMDNMPSLNQHQV